MKEQPKTYEQLRDAEASKISRGAALLINQTHEYKVRENYFSLGADWALTLPLSTLAEKHEGVRGLVENLDVALDGLRRANKVLNTAEIRAVNKGGEPIPQKLFNLERFAVQNITSKVKKFRQALTDRDEIISMLEKDLRRCRMASFQPGSRNSPRITGQYIASEALNKLAEWRKNHE